MALACAWASLGENAQRRSDWEAQRSFVARVEPWQSDLRTTTEDERLQ